MAEDALPCIVCGIRLKNVYNQLENQPAKGSILTDYGNYGSTVWDPQDGSFLKLNICDECLVRAGENGQVLVGRSKRPVVTIRRVHIGWERIDRTMVEWKHGIGGAWDADDVVEVCTVEDFDELTQAKDRAGRHKITWIHGPEKTQEMVEYDWNEQVERDRRQEEDLPDVR